MYTQIRSSVVLLTLNMSINVSNSSVKYHISLTLYMVPLFMECPFHPLSFPHISFKSQLKNCFTWEAIPDARVDLDVLKLSM